LIDQLDGRLALARPHRGPAVQAFGAHLDCYADFVSKGVFPALMLLVLTDFGLLAWVVAGIQLAVIAFRYSYEFVPGAAPRGLSPDYSVLVFSLLFLAPSLAQAPLFPILLGPAMLFMAVLNLAPLQPPKLAGIGLAAFVSVALGLMGLLLTTG
jgi:CDP-diacylglycerol---serine O-phosphatidyltransferase